MLRQGVHLGAHLPRLLQANTRKEGELMAQLLWGSIWLIVGLALLSLAMVEIAAILASVQVAF